MTWAAAGTGGTQAPPKLVILDLDGTLVDSVPDLAACIDAMLAELGLPPRGEARVREWVGNGVERLVERSLTGNQEGRPDRALFQRALPRFLHLYAARTSELSRVYPGAGALLDYLENNGVHRVCVTNKPARYTESLLHDLGLLQRFDLVLSGDSLEKKKPDPLPLLHAARHFGLEPGECLMIGDSRSDVAAARAAGVPVVCVSYGYNHGEPIETARPDAVIGALDELPGLLGAPVPAGG